MAAYYPRWLLTLSVPALGSRADRRGQLASDDVVQWTMPVKSFRWQKNDFTQADTLECEVDWTVAGIDPRLLADAVGVFFLGNASSPDAWDGVESVPATTGTGATNRTLADALRFVGILRRPARRLSMHEASVSLLFHDYTSIYLSEKPFVTRGVPSYDQTLRQAWARICDHVGWTDPGSGQIVSAVTFLRDRLVFRGEAKDVVLGQAVAARFRGTPIAAEVTDAWAVWLQCVGMAGLISFIERDQVIVTTATDYFTRATPPRLIWGKNIVSLEEDRDPHRSGQGVVLTSFDPLTGTTIEAFWPPLGDPSERRKHLKAKAARASGESAEAEKRVHFAFPGVTDPGKLEDIAKMVHAIRSREELAGRLTTGEFFVESGVAGAAGGAFGPGAPFDLLSLGAGDVIQVEIEREHFQQLLHMPSTLGGGATDAARVNLLVGYGYDPGVAQLLVRNLAAYDRLGCSFFTKSVTVSGDANAKKFEIEIHYVNRITDLGDALSA